MKVLSIALLYFISKILEMRDKLRKKELAKNEMGKRIARKVMKDAFNGNITSRKNLAD